MSKDRLARSACPGIEEDGDVSVHTSSHIGPDDTEGRIHLRWFVLVCQCLSQEIFSPAPTFGLPFAGSKGPSGHVSDLHHGLARRRILCDGMTRVVAGPDFSKRRGR